MNNLKTLLLKMSKINTLYNVIVEGNIGSGKTCFLEHFSKHDKLISILPEPVEMWRNCNGHNLLALMYTDPKKWSFTFQNYVQLTMTDRHQQMVPNPVKLMERSIYSARNIFIEKLSRDGILAQPSLSVLDKWFQWLIQNANIKVDLVVYLRTTPEVVYERILKRNRPEERTITLDYIKSLHELHENWLVHKNLHSCPAPVLVLNADLDKSIIGIEYERLEGHILNLIPQQVSVT